MLTFLIRSLLLSFLGLALGPSVLLGRLSKEFTDSPFLLSQCDKISDEPFRIVTGFELWTLLARLKMSNGNLVYCSRLYSRL